jgi:hypothetical protein
MAAKRLSNKKLDQMIEMIYRHDHNGVEIPILSIPKIYKAAREAYEKAPEGKVNVAEIRKAIADAVNAVKLEAVATFNKFVMSEGFFDDEETPRGYREADFEQAELEAAGRDYSRARKRMLALVAQGKYAEAAKACTHGGGYPTNSPAAQNSKDPRAGQPGYRCSDCGSYFAKARDYMDLRRGAEATAPCELLQKAAPVAAPAAPASSKATSGSVFWLKQSKTTKSCYAMFRYLGSTRVYVLAVIGATQRIDKEMSVEDARKQWSELIKQGWFKIESADVARAGMTERTLKDIAYD